MERKGASGSDPAGRQHPPVDRVFLQLERILRSEIFSRAERPRRFLRFLVEQALNRENTAVTEHSLALEVFNRPPNFDSGVDPIVRVEAGRLRRKLLEYYHTEGRDDELVITLPPRTYVPEFYTLPESAREMKPSPDPTRRLNIRKVAIAGALLIAALGVGVYGTLRSFRHGSMPERPDTPGLLASAQAIVVLPIEDRTAKLDRGPFCYGLTEELTEELERVAGLKVVGSATAFGLEGKAQDLRRVGHELDVSLALHGSVREGGGGIRIALELTDTTTGYDVWYQHFDRVVSDPVTVQEEVAREVVRNLIANRLGTHATFQEH